MEKLSAGQKRDVNFLIAGAVGVGVRNECSPSVDVNGPALAMKRKRGAFSGIPKKPA
jgi:hypothetical protein